MVELGILAIIPFVDILQVNVVPALNGMFVVENPKAAPIVTADDLLDVVRLIMNRTPSNHWQRMIIGDLADLPVWLTWQQLALSEDAARLRTLSCPRRRFLPLIHI